MKLEGEIFSMEELKCTLENEIIIHSMQIKTAIKPTCIIHQCKNPYPLSGEEETRELPMGKKENGVFSRDYEDEELDEESEEEIKVLEKEIEFEKNPPDIQAKINNDKIEKEEEDLNKFLV